MSSQITKDELKATMGSFTWFWGIDWFIETDIGNFHWKDADYGDVGMMSKVIPFDGTYDEFCRHLNLPHGRDKGFNLVGNKIGDRFEIVFDYEQVVS